MLSEPSVIAVNLKTDSVISVGQEAYDMVGKTPSHIQAIRPLSKGVVCDYKMTEEMVKFFIKKVCRDSLVKPRIALCVPSGITNVESNAVIDVAIASGARKVYLIEEPVAAAIGANIDIEKPNGSVSWRHRRRHHRHRRPLLKRHRQQKIDQGRRRRHQRLDHQIHPLQPRRLNRRADGRPDQAHRRQRLLGGRRGHLRPGQGPQPHHRPALQAWKSAARCCTTA